MVKVGDWIKQEDWPEFYKVATIFGGRLRFDGGNEYHTYPVDLRGSYGIDWVFRDSPSAEHPSASSGAQREKMNVLPYDLVPFQEIADAYSRVAEKGAEKYSAWNWSKGLARVQLIGSLMRHTFAYLRGEDFDKETGLSHTDHILWNAVALSHNVHHGLEDGRRIEPEREYKA